MSLKSSKKISGSEYEIEISVTPEEFDKEVNKVYKTNIKKINVPGFRVGKAPRAFVEKYYGENIFYEDAIKNIYPREIEKAVQELKLELVEVSKMDVVTSSRKEGLVFKANLIVVPDIEIDGYKGIEVVKVSSEITDEDISKEIENVKFKNSRLVTVEDRPAKEGDSVVIDFEGFVDGAPFEDGRANNFPVELGAHQFIEGFEQQIIGHNTGDEFDINVKFPKDYRVQDLAEKDATFKTKLYEIKERELPEMDDEFVKDISEFDTLEEYKEDLKKQVAERKKSEAHDKQEMELMKKVAGLVKSEIPEVMIDKKFKDIIKNFEYELENKGLRLEDYKKYMGKEYDMVAQHFRDDAETEVKLSLALKKIAELENISYTKEELDKEYDDIAKQFNITKDKVKNIVVDEEVGKDIKSRKAMDIVKEHMVVKEEEK